MLIACKSNKPISRSNSKINKGSEASTIKSNKSKVENLIKSARTYLGVKYRYAGNDRNGIDCSGLTCASFKTVEISLPRTANDQAGIGKRVYIGELRKGDLVFFTDKKGNTKITHVGIVTNVTSSSVTFIHASTKKGVIENELLTGYYRELFLKAVRVLE